MTTDQPRQGVFIALFAICFIAILAASLIQRIQHPDLIHKRESNVAQAPAMGNMAAIGELMRQAAQEPANRDVLLKLVESLMAVGEWQSAENFAQKVLALDPPDQPDSKALYLLAIAHHNKGEHQQAAELLEKLLERADDPAARYGLGILNIYFLGNPEAGAGHLRKGLALPNLSKGLKDAMREELEKLPAPKERAPLPDAAAPAAP